MPPKSPDAASLIQLRVFGSPALLTRDAAGGVSTLLPAGKPLLVLCYLVCHPEGWVSRDQLVDLAWGASDEQSAKGSLRQALYRLRQLLGSEWVETSDSGVRLAAPLPSDWGEATDALRLGHDGVLLDLIAGPFLEGLDDTDHDGLGTWLGAERSRWDHVVRDAAVREGRKALVSGRIEAAITLAERAIATLDDQLASWELLLDGLQATAVSSRIDDGLARLEIAGTQGGLIGAVGPGWRALVYRVRRASGPTPRSDAPSSKPMAEPLPLVGREPLLSHLQSALQSPIEGRYGVAVIQGGPGFGKSRLLREYRLRNSGSGRRDVLIVARSGEAATPWACLIRLVEALAAFPEALGINPAAAARLVTLNPELRARFPGSVGLATAVATPRELADALAELLEAVGETEALTLLLDDAQWGDEASFAVLRATLDRSGSGRVACLVATRDELLLRAPSWPVIHLPSLSADDLDTLMAEKVTGLNAEERRAAVSSLMLVTGGVPIYVGRAIQRLVQDRERFRSPVELLSAITTLELHRDSAFPSSLAERLLLGYLASADGPVELAELEALDGSATGESVSQCLARAQERGWVMVSADGIALTHDLVWRQVTDTLTALERRSLALRRARWLVDQSTDFRNLQMAIRFYLTHGEHGLAARAVARWSRRVQTGPRGRALAALVLPSDAPRLLRWRIAASTTPMLMPWLVAVAVLLALGSWGALQWFRQPVALRLENAPNIEAVATDDGALFRTNSIFPIFSVRDRLGRISRALDNSRLVIFGWSPSVDSARLNEPVVVQNGLVIASTLEMYAGIDDSETVAFQVGKLPPLAVTVSRGFAYTRLAIDGGLINGVAIAREHPEVTVAPGDSLRGLISLRYNTPTHAAAWMLAETSTMRPAIEDTTTVATLHAGAIDALTEVIIQRKAPMKPGQYWLVWAFAAERDAVSILSLTNWRCPAKLWNDGNDLLSVGDSGLHSVWGGGELSLDRDLCEPNEPPRRELTVYPTAAMRVVVR
jgi:DNA-binding SARP family transcriptional activator